MCWKHCYIYNNIWRNKCELSMADKYRWRCDLYRYNWSYKFYFNDNWNYRINEQQSLQIYCEQQLSIKFYFYRSNFNCFRKCLNNGRASKYKHLRRSSNFVFCNCIWFFIPMAGEYRCWCYLFKY